MQAVKEKVYAKINLTLDVKNAENGYHELDSLVASIDLCDEIRLCKRKDKQVTLKMHGIELFDLPMEKNNAYKAAVLFMQTYQTNGVDIEIRKNIPVGAGLGGSSADAAGVLNGLAKLYKIEDENGLDALADRLGSDTKYMRHGGYARMRGRGEKLEYLPVKQVLWFLLLCPSSSVSTAECFHTLDCLRLQGDCGYFPRTQACVESLCALDKERVGRLMGNDLYQAALTLNDELLSVKQEADGFSPLGATMTGSGSGVIALFEERELCEWAKSRYRGDAEAIVVKTIVK
ncbi:MAG: 4-(cytidine 5'-diphospho)-2-C-methyl-D-erythritol kinase [Clostridia bacterium]|nr:4-(cytidine 5'-diphospho)-2-C-methyl-D-erythritol kinase [Clostridia bacterium]